MNIKQYISATMLALIGLGFTACDGKDEPKYDAATKPANSQRVYFAKDKISQIVTADETEVMVPVYRPEKNSDNELTVQILTTFSDEADSEIFKVAPEVTFAANQSFTQIPVRYDINAMASNTPYSIYLAIDEANADVYGLASTELVLNYEVMTDWALLKGDTDEQDGYGSWVIGSPFGAFSFPARVFERHIPSDVNQMEYIMQVYLPSLIDEDFDASTADIEHNDNIDDPDWIDTWTLSTSDGGKTIEFPIQACILEDGIYYAEASILFPDEFENESDFDPVTGIFTVNVMCFDAEGPWNPAKWFINLNGYADTNVYTLSLTDNGQINIADKDYAIIAFNFSSTINLVDYTVVEIADVDEPLTEEQVAEIAETIQDPEQTDYIVETIKQSGNVSLTFPSSGNFEIVAVGYHQNGGTYEAKATATCVFSFETFDPYKGWTQISDNALFTDNLFSLVFDADLEQELTVSIDASDEYEGLYRISNPYVTSPFIEPAGCTLAPFGSIEFVITDDNKVYFPYSQTGLIDEDGEWSICSYSYAALSNGMDISEIPAMLFGTAENGKISLEQSTLQSQGKIIPTFLIYFGKDGGYSLNMPFALDMNIGSGAKAVRANKAVKSMGKLSRKALCASTVKSPSFPAHFKATAEKCKPGKLMTTAERRRR